MNSLPLSAVTSLGLGTAWAVLALEPEPAGPPGEPEPLPRVVVTGYNDPTRDWAPLGTESKSPGAATKARIQDAAGLLADVPGVAVVRNGSQTGLPQIRGLHADRVKVLVNGMTISPACPNHMDPPLHYLAPSRTAALVVVPGVTPVSLGGDSIAGTVVADSAPPHFGTNAVWRPFGEVFGSGSSANDGWAAATTLGIANNRYSVAYDGSFQGAGDYRFPGGRVRDSGYDIMHHELRGAARISAGVISAEAGLSRTRDTGTPALPMDMIKDDGYQGGAAFDGDLGFASLQARVYHHQTDHLMDNYSLRPAGPMRMSSPAESADTGFVLGAVKAVEPHTYRLGVDFHDSQFDAYQQNADTGRRQTTINDGSRDRLGGYAEWQADWSPRWHTLLGVRADAVWADTGPVENYFPAAKPDAVAFNANRRAIDDLDLDATAAIRFTPNEGSAYEIGAARKNRAPNLIERYLWTPLSASAGQADGRTYLGNLDLDPETAWQFNLTAGWQGSRWRAKVSPFYTLVEDYIQGRPIARLDATKQPVLQYQNLDRAELYGVDASAEWEFVKHFTLGGLLSYVRGRDCEYDDNLYRIAPLRGRVDLTWRSGRFESGIEGVLVARQDEVAAYNGEPPTPGYALMNLRAGWNVTRRLTLQAGVDNVLDEFYADHLGGINRVAGSDVAIGQRLPGLGRFVYGALRLSWD